MFDFIIATNTPVKVRDFLIARGIGQMVDDGQGNQVFTGAHSGMKFTASGIPNPVPDFRPGGNLRMYLFRFVRDMEEADRSDTGVVVDTGDPDPRLTKSRIARWVRNNGTPVTVGLGDNWNYNPETGEWVEDVNATETMITAWRVTFDGGQFYLIRDISKIGVWQ